MRITSYIHGDKETEYDDAIEAGLSEAAASKFRYSLYEVVIEQEVDEITGKSSIVSVNGCPLVLEA